MGLISRTYTFVDGATAAGLITAARLNDNFDAVFDEFNGNIDEDNVKDSCNIPKIDGNYTVSGTWNFSSTSAATIAGAWNFTGKMFINDTANAQMTEGLTINQLAADNEILSFKSSDVGHGVTTITETDTFAYFMKVTAGATGGGLTIEGLSEATTALELVGTATTDNTTQSGTGRAPVEVCAYKKSGTTHGALGANANAFIVRMNDSTKFIVDEDGDFLYDGADGGAYDDHEDAVMCHDISMTLSKQFNKVIKYNEKKLKKLGVLRGEHFVSGKALNMLFMGAISQLYGQVKELEGQIKLLTA